MVESSLGSNRSQDRLRRSSNALLLNTALTGVLGLVFWQIAAHRWSPEVIGRDGVLINSAVAIATFSYMNLPYAIMTIFPTARNVVGLACKAYVGTALVAATAATVVLVTGTLGSSGLTRATSAVAIGFIALAALTTTFALQDSMLTAIGRWAVVPAENLLFGIAKIVVLLAIPVAAIDHPILASWLLPIPLVIIGANLVLARTAHRLKRSLRRRTTVRWLDQPRFIAGDLIGSLANNLLHGALPLLVLASTSARQNGFFYAAYVIGSQLSNVGLFVGLSFTAEASRHPGETAALARTALWRSVLLTTTLCAGVALLGPIVMRFYGPDYVTNATATLRLLGFAALPMPFLAVFMAIGRVNRRSGRALLVEVATAVGVLTLATPLIRRFGGPGAALAMFIVTTTVAIVIAPRLWSDLGGRRLQLRVPTVDRKVWPIGIRQGKPISGATAALIALSLCGVVLVALDAPGWLRVPGALVTMTLLPGLLWTSFDRWDDTRIIALVLGSVTAWILVTQLLLAVGWWKPLALAAIAPLVVAGRLVALALDGALAPDVVVVANELDRVAA